MHTAEAATDFPVVPYDEWGRRGQHVELADGKVFYVRKGNGFPLVLVHMFGGNSWWYSRVFDRFAEEFDVVALDLPGCARSDTPPLPYDVPDVAAALEQFLDALGIERCHLIAIGGASMTAVQLATTRPERIARLVLEALCVWTRDEAKELWETTIKNRWIDENGQARSYAEWGKLDQGWLSLDEPTRALAIDRMTTDMKEHARWWVSLLTVGQLRYDVNSRLASIACPTLLLTGGAAHDFLRKHEELVLSTIPDVKFALVPHARTTSPFDQPQAYWEIVGDFLRREP